ncbi:glycoside hydrolase family 15 protein [Pseudonocardia pini]|uniref:glycoside hydrolase family 15 protein n=1 Tax=Pseudonocardia pini TaxID=2758030 RepID=UPI0015F0E958|nr:glycoside hydrolase family 15 protein [Pseudonocardia pini]
MAYPDDYPPIAEHGLIGDLQTAALVTTDGSIDWFCCPRFDSPSVFGSLLDRRRGGFFRIAPDTNAEVTRRQWYFHDTAVLMTRFMTPDGVGALYDFMPVRDGAATDRHEIVRVLRVVRGTMRFTVECRPRFDYGRAPHTLELTPDGPAFHGPDLDLALHTVVDGGGALDWRAEEQDVSATITLSAGQAVGAVLESGADVRPRRIPIGQADAKFDETVHFWRSWLERSTYSGRWRETVHRSAMSLKLMTYAPTGALVAAPTAGLPEQPGGERNWDYRYTWIRDASFSVHALLSLGYTEEAAAFGSWLADRINSHDGPEDRPLRIMYRVDGTADLTEETLDHLEGYRGSRPVRVGNGAADQLQLDIVGEALYSLQLADQHAVRLDHRGWQAVRRLVGWLCENWDSPDEGVWETRGGRRDFVYGRLMSWVAFDRAIRMARDRARPGDIPEWTRQRDLIYDQVIEKGWDPGRRAFVQYLGGDVLDASVLMMPRVGFVVPTDPLWGSTLRAIDEGLVSDGLVFRYDPAASPDGLAGTEGTFSLCSFWYVDALARSGRLGDARTAFEKMLTYANHLGLYSEEIGATGEQLGNFPQAFSHLALISAAVDLDHQLDHGAGVVAPELGRLHPLG